MPVDLPYLRPDALVLDTGQTKSFNTDGSNARPVYLIASCNRVFIEDSQHTGYATGSVFTLHVKVTKERRYLVVGVSSIGSAVAAASVTVGGVAVPSVVSQPTLRCRVELFDLFDLPVGTAPDYLVPVVVTMADTTAVEVVATVFSGVAAPSVAFPSHEGVTWGQWFMQQEITAHLDVATVTDECAVVDVFSCDQVTSGYIYSYPLDANQRVLPPGSGPLAGEVLVSGPAGLGGMTYKAGGQTGPTGQVAPKRCAPGTTRMARHFVGTAAFLSEPAHPANAAMVAMAIRPGWTYTLCVKAEGTAVGSSGVPRPVYLRAECTVGEVHDPVHHPEGCNALVLQIGHATGSGGSPRPAYARPQCYDPHIHPATLLTFHAQQYPGGFTVSGSVSPRADGVSMVGGGILLTGGLNGTVACDAAGHFGPANVGVSNVNTLVVVQPNNSLDGWGDGVDESIANVAPSLTVVATPPTVPPGGGFITLSGVVTDEAPAGLTVSFTGPPGFSAGGATVLADGSYSVSAGPIPAGVHGVVTASVTDWYGATGTATTTI